MKYFILYALFATFPMVIYPSKGNSSAFFNNNKPKTASTTVNTPKNTQPTTLQKYAIQAKNSFQPIGQKLGVGNLGIIDTLAQTSGLQMKKSPLTVNQEAAIKMRNTLAPIGQVTGIKNAGIIDFMAGTKGKNIDQAGNVIETFTPSAQNNGLTTKTTYIEPMRSKKGLEITSSETYDPQFTQGLKQKFVDTQGTTYEKFDISLPSLQGLKSKVTTPTGTSTKFYEPLLSKEGLKIEHIEANGTKVQKFDPLFSNSPTKITYPQHQPKQLNFAAVP